MCHRLSILPEEREGYYCFHFISQHLVYFIKKKKIAIIPNRYVCVSFGILAALTRQQVSNRDSCFYKVHLSGMCWCFCKIKPLSCYRLLEEFFTADNMLHKRDICTINSVLFIDTQFTSLSPHSRYLCIKNVQIVQTVIPTV